MDKFLAHYFQNNFRDFSEPLEIIVIPNFLYKTFLPIYANSIHPDKIAHWSNKL